MTDHLRALAEAEAERVIERPVPGDELDAAIRTDQVYHFIEGFIAGRTSVADEIEAERLDTDWEALGADAYINGLIKSEEIAREGRDETG